jgi:hypothetical protein
MNRIGPWCHIVDCLRAGVPGTAPSTRKLATYAMQARRNPAPKTMTDASAIKRIEWQTVHTILVSWSDSTLGQYHDQTWRAGFARAPGVCGLTGVPVRRGDAVFRPFVRGGIAPMNAPVMILAKTLLQEEP